MNAWNMNYPDQYIQNLKEFIASFEDLDDDAFNLKPDAHTWSVAENVEHIYRAEFGTFKLFNGPKKEAEHDIDARITELEKLFGDRNRKLTASGPVQPTAGNKVKDEYIRRLTKNREMVANLLNEGLNTEELCLLYPHPVFGELTVREWLYFNMAHAKRHKAQIEGTRRVLGI
jgi:uncharacterized damage-inducible protein DinB